jgi:hypothetical protein
LCTGAIVRFSSIRPRALFASTIGARTWASRSSAQPRGRHLDLSLAPRSLRSRKRLHLRPMGGRRAICPIEVRNRDVWVKTTLTHADLAAHCHQRLANGLAHGPTTPCAPFRMRWSCPCIPMAGRISVRTRAVLLTHWALERACGFSSRPLRPSSRLPRERVGAIGTPRRGFPAGNLSSSGLLSLRLEPAMADRTTPNSGHVTGTGSRPVNKTESRQSFRFRDARARIPG